MLAKSGAKKGQTVSLSGLNTLAALRSCADKREAEGKNDG